MRSEDHHYHPELVQNSVSYVHPTLMYQNLHLNKTFRYFGCLSNTPLIFSVYSSDVLFGCFPQLQVQIHPGVMHCIYGNWHVSLVSFNLKQFYESTCLFSISRTFSRIQERHFRKTPLHLYMPDTNSSLKEIKGPEEGDKWNHKEATEK